MPELEDSFYRCEQICDVTSGQVKNSSDPPLMSVLQFGKIIKRDNETLGSIRCKGNGICASPLCHQDSIKPPLVTSGQATAGSFVPSRLSCAQSGDLAFCSAALLPRVFCPTT